MSTSEEMPTSSATMRPPIVVSIVGTTGVGKSQLAVELARALNGEVINSDALQVYKGMPIITNKMPIDERLGVRHHLLDFYDPFQEYRIPVYERDACAVVDALHCEGKLPIVCGGTAYYTTSLLFKDMLPSSKQLDDEDGSGASPQGSTDPRLEKTTDELYATLREVDPIMTQRWHPRDRRKIRRSLEIYYTTGQRQSDMYAAQREAGRLGPDQVRQPTLVIWIYSDQDVLDRRLDERCDQMLRAGLLDEIRDMHCAAKDAGAKPDFERGIWQAIGYKEFCAWLESGDEADKERGLERMKIATRQYARKQVKWIRNKLALQCRDAGSSVQLCLLDATDLSNWQEAVGMLGTQAVHAFQSSLTDGGATFAPSEYCDPKLAPLLEPKQEREFSSAHQEWKQTRCDTCHGYIALSEAEWQQHLTSRSHKRQLARIKKRAEVAAFLARRRQDTHSQSSVTCGAQSS